MAAPFTKVTVPAAIAGHADQTKRFLGSELYVKLQRLYNMVEDDDDEEAADAAFAALVTAGVPVTEATILAVGNAEYTLRESIRLVDIELSAWDGYTKAE